MPGWPGLRFTSVSTKTRRASTFLSGAMCGIRSAITLGACGMVISVARSHPALKFEVHFEGHPAGGLKAGVEGGVSIAQLLAAHPALMELSPQAVEIRIFHLLDALL